MNNFIDKIISWITSFFNPVIIETDINTIDKNDILLKELKEKYYNFDTWFDKCRNECRPCYVIKDCTTDRIFGIAILKDTVDKITEVKKTKLCTMYIDKQFRRMGYGRKLFKEVAKHTLENGSGYLYATIPESNYEIWRFMNTMGMLPIQQSNLNHETFLIEDIKTIKRNSNI